MQWHEACTGSSLVTTRYEAVPPLDSFPLYDCYLDPGLPSLNISGYLPRLPDNPNLPEGQIPDRADILLSFIDLFDLTLSGVPSLEGGSLNITTHSKDETRFEYESDTFTFSGSCRQAAICAFRVLTKHDPAHQEPRGPRLFSHRNVWNSCLLLIKEYGYQLRVSGHPALAAYPHQLRWDATTAEGTKLSADSPIELLGLVALHRYHQPDEDEPYWWRIDGPELLTNLITEWEQRTGGTQST